MQVQWGAWTMVLPLLDALRTVTERAVDYDFVINLSDADLALRTNEEILRFLRPYRASFEELPSLTRDCGRAPPAAWAAPAGPQQPAPAPAPHPQAQARLARRLPA